MEYQSARQQPNLTREQLVGLGLLPVAAYVLPDRPKATADANRQKKCRKNRVEAGLTRLDTFTTAEAKVVLSKLAKAAVTGSFEKELKALLEADAEEFEFVTGHTDDSQAPGIELWVRVMLSLPDNPPTQFETPSSRRSQEYELGRYVLQLTGWRYGLFDLAHRLATFKLSDLIPKKKSIPHVS